jgi:hypothetical protein
MADAQRKMTKLRKQAPDLANLVEEGMDIDEAIAAMRQRKQERAAKRKQLEASELAIFRRAHGLPRPTEQEELEYGEFVKRREAFNALPQKEKVEMARFVLAHDPELARGVIGGWVHLWEAFHELKQAEAFLEELDRRGLPKIAGPEPCPEM